MGLDNSTRVRYGRSASKLEASLLAPFVAARPVWLLLPFGTWEERPGRKVVRVKWAGTGTYFDLFPIPFFGNRLALQRSSMCDTLPLEVMCQVI